MSAFDVFGTDKEAEVNGVEIDYGTFSITIARAGGANKKYTRALEAASKPYRRAIQTGTIQTETLNNILREVYAKTVVLSWKNVKDSNGQEVPCTVEGITWLFKELPDLFEDIQAQASNLALFRTQKLDEELGN